MNFRSEVNLIIIMWWNNEVLLVVVVMAICFKVYCIDIMIGCAVLVVFGILFHINTTRSKCCFEHDISLIEFQAVYYPLSPGVFDGLCQFIFQNLATFIFLSKIQNTKILKTLKTKFFKSISLLCKYLYSVFMQ